MSPAEMKGFKSYLKGLYPQKTVLHHVFDYLHKYHPDYRFENKLEAGYAHQKIFARPLKTKSHRSNLFNTLGEIKNYLEDYLLWGEMQKDTFRRDETLLEIYRERNIYDFYKKYFDKAWQRLEQNDNLDMWNESRRLRLKHDRYFYRNTDGFEGRTQTLNETIRHLNALWISGTLKYACEMSFITGMQKEKMNYPLLEEAKSMCLEPPYSGNIFNKIYLLMLRLLEEEDFEAYLELKQLIFNNYQLAEPNDKSLFYGFLLNYVSQKMKRGQILLYGEEPLDIYRFGLYSGIVLEDGKISSVAFNNIITTACRAKDIAFAREVIEKLAGNLEDKLRADAVKIAEAIIAIEEAQYDKALEFLNTGEFFSPDLGLRYRIIKSQCLFEIRSFDVLEYHLNAFEHWIRRNVKKLGLPNQEATLNMIKYTRLLTRPEGNSQKMLEELEKAPYLFNKAWLIEKLNDLK